MIQIIDLKIDPEFRDKIPPLTDAEYEQLKDNILCDGEVYEPICVWNGTIVDGHNRWKIIQEHPTIPFRTKEMSFADKWEAFDWMYKKQLGRRNLTDEQRTVLIGKMYEARKKSHGNNAKRGDDGQYLSTQNGNTGEQPQRISDQIAQELGVAKNTVIRAERFSKGIDKIKEVSQEAADKILSGNAGVTKRDVMELPKMEPKKVKEFAESVVSGEIKAQKENKGFNKAMREQKKLVDEVIADMYNPELKPFTIDMLEGDIEINGQNYIDMLRSTLIDRSTLLIGDNRPRVAAKIDYIISEIQKIRRLVE